MMGGEFIVAILLLIVIFHSELKARLRAAAFEKETERQYEEGIAFYKRLPTMSLEELNRLGEEDE